MKTNPVYPQLSFTLKPFTIALWETRILCSLPPCPSSHHLSPGVKHPFVSPLLIANQWSTSLLNAGTEGSSLPQAEPRAPSSSCLPAGPITPSQSFVCVCGAASIPPIPSSTSLTFQTQPYETSCSTDWRMLVRQDPEDFSRMFLCFFPLGFSVERFRFSMQSFVE